VAKDDLSVNFEDLCKIVSEYHPKKVRSFSILNFFNCNKVKYCSNKFVQIVPKSDDERWKITQPPLLLYTLANLAHVP